MLFGMGILVTSSGGYKSLSSKRKTFVFGRAGSRIWEEWIGGHAVAYLEQQSPEPLLLDTSRKRSVRFNSTMSLHRSFSFHVRWWFNFRRNGSDGDWLVLERGEFQEHSEENLLTQMLWTSSNSNFSRPNGSTQWFEMQGA